MRKIDRKKWIDEAPPSWIPKGEYWADSIGDLGTHQGTLSIWSVDPSDQTRIVTAITALRDKVLPCDYILFEEDALAQAGFAIQHTEGNALDQGLAQTSHFDIVELTERSLVALASFFREQKFETCVVPTIAQRLATALVNREIDGKRIPPQWQKQLKKDGLVPPSP